MPSWWSSGDGMWSSLVGWNFGTVENEKIKTPEFPISANATPHAKKLHRESAPLFGILSMLRHSRQCSSNYSPPNIPLCHVPQTILLKDAFVPHFPSSDAPIRPGCKSFPSLLENCRPALAPLLTLGSGPTQARCCSAQSITIASLLLT